MNIRDEDAWDALISFLRQVLYLNKLFISNLNNDGDSIQVASPKIATQICQLQVQDYDDYHFSNAIWSSFLNVEEYSVCCNCEKPTFEAAKDWADGLGDLRSSRWKLYLSRLATPYQLLAFRHVTHLIFSRKHKNVLFLLFGV